MKNNIDYFHKNSAYHAIFFISIIFFTVLFSTLKQGINHFFNLHIHYSVFGLAFIFSILIDYILRGKKIEIRSLVINITLLIIFIIISSSAEIFGAWDGVLYHKPAMYWQYFSHNLIYATADEIPFWSVLYPKLTWIFSGELTNFIGKFEALTVYSLLFSAGLYFYSYYFCRIFEIRKYYTHIFSFLIVVNPVAISQILSTYVDSSLFSLVALIFLSAAAITRKNDFLSKIIFITSSIIIINIKYSAFLFVGIAFLYLGLFYIRNIKKQIEIFIYFLIFVVMGILVIGANPYIKNIVEGKHFFHPVFGSEKVEIMSQNTPKSMRDKNRFVKFFYANFSSSKTGLEDPEIKNPLKIKKQEFKNVSFNYDIRIGGFGPLFPLVLILFSIYFLLSIFSKEKKGVKFDIFLMSFFAILLNPEAWWARYSPPTYILVLVPLLVSIKDKEERVFKSLKNTIAYLLLIQTIVISYYQVLNMKSHNDYAENKFLSLSNKKIYVSKYDSHIKNIIHFFPRYKINVSYYDGNNLICIREKSILYSYISIRYCESENDLRSFHQPLSEDEDILNISQFPNLPYSYKMGDKVSEEIRRGINFIKLGKDKKINGILNFDTFSGVLIDEIKLHQFLNGEDNTKEFLIIGWDSLVPDANFSDMNILINENISKSIKIKNFQPLKFRQAFIALMSNDGIIHNITYGEPEEDLIILVNYKTHQTDIIK